MSRFAPIACGVVTLIALLAPIQGYAAGLPGRINAVSARADTLAEQSWNNDAETALADDIDSICDDFHAQAADGVDLASTSRKLLRVMETLRSRYL